MMQKIEKIISKSLDNISLNAEEIASLYEVSLFSREAALIQTGSRAKSERSCDELAEVHAQVGINIAPCAQNCLFCSFAKTNEVFKKSIEFPFEEVTARAKQFESDGANAIYFMTTAHYPLDRFIEFAKDVKRALLPETVMIANVGDFDTKGAKKLVDAGFSGIYHAVRLGEGVDTAIPVETRLATMRAAQEHGLIVGTCVEPIGLEHSIGELVEKTVITREARPAYSGAARRIPIPGTKMGKFGAVTEAKMAHILAVVRLALGTEIPGNCTHEPNVIGAVAGANLLWAESGSNPRDTEADTQDKRGMTVAECRRVFEEANWKVLSGPSFFYRNFKSACY